MDDMFPAADILPETGATDTAVALGKILAEHRGGDVTVLDMRALNFWTDFFVIATVTSGAHLQGLERHVKDFSLERGIDIRGRSRKPGNAGDEWRFIDLGTIVIHLMTAKARSFYELERLWSAAAILYHENPADKTAQNAPNP